MKINFKKIITNIKILCLFLASTNICYADEPITGSNVMPIKTVLIKFGIAMGSVIISLLIIWILLNLYKSYYGSKTLKSDNKLLYEEKLNTPKDMDEALIKFIDNES